VFALLVVNYFVACVVGSLCIFLFDTLHLEIADVSDSLTDVPDRHVATATKPALEMVLHVCVYLVVLARSQHPIRRIENWVDGQVRVGVGVGVGVGEIENLVDGRVGGHVGVDVRSALIPVVWNVGEQDARHLNPVLHY
tara:strand:- start:118 stop:534 length:417 start_codon:yes stop_codon:yes gene_type:complete